MDMIQYIGSIGGIGGVFAIIMFMVYRQTIRQMREDRKYAENRLTTILIDYNKVVSESTKMQTELIVWLKAKNGSK